MACERNNSPLEAGKKPAVACVDLGVWGRGWKGAETMRPKGARIVTHLLGYPLGLLEVETAREAGEAAESNIPCPAVADVRRSPPRGQTC